MGGEEAPCGAASALLVLLAAALSANIYASCTSPSTVMGMSISPAAISVALGAGIMLFIAVEATAGGPKREIVLDMTGLRGSLRVVPLAVEGGGCHYNGGGVNRVLVDGDMDNR